MKERDALYAAILAHPDEDTPRLVFADWLDENGESEYAAFIRKQIELAYVPEWEEDALREFYKYTGGTPVFEPALAEQELPEPCGWVGQSVHRGFQCGVEVHTAENSSSWVQAFPEVFRIAPVDSLELWGKDRSIPQWKEFVTSPHLAKVRKLDIKLADLNVEQVRQLVSSTHTTALRELEIGFDSETAAIAFLRSRLAGQLTALKFVIRGDVSAAGVEAFHSLLKKSSLRSLTLHGLAGFWPGFCAAPLDKLESITCYSTFESGGVSLFTRSLTGRRLRALHLRGPVTDAGAEALAGCAALSELRDLRLEGCELKSRGAQVLAKSPHLKNLLRLNLSQNKIGDGGAAAIVKSPHLANLLVLFLRGCDAGDKTGEAVLGSSLATRVLCLDLLISKISPGMKRTLSRRLKQRVGV